MKRIRVERLRRTGLVSGGRHPEWVMDIVGDVSDVHIHVPSIRKWERCKCGASTQSHRRMFFKAMGADTAQEAQRLSKHVRGYTSVSNTFNVRHLPEMTGAYTLRASGGRVAV